MTDTERSPRPNRAGTCGPQSQSCLPNDEPSGRAEKRRQHSDLQPIAWTALPRASADPQTVRTEPPRHSKTQQNSTVARISGTTRLGIVGSQRTIAGWLSSCGGSDADEVIQCCCAATGARASDLRITSRSIPLFGQDTQLICRAMKFGDSGMSSELVDVDKSWSLAINNDGASVARWLSQIFLCPSSACFVDH